MLTLQIRIAQLQADEEGLRKAVTAASAMGAEIPEVKAAQMLLSSLVRAKLRKKMAEEIKFA